MLNIQDMTNEFLKIK